MFSHECVTCKAPFSSVRRGARFCCKTCNSAFWNRPENRHPSGEKKLNCLHCGTPFSRVWPNAIQIFCTKACTLADYVERNREKINAKSEEQRTITNRPAVLAAKRKWNAKDSAKEKKRLYRENHMPEIIRNFLERYHADPQFKANLQSRSNARRKLKRSGREMKCSECGSTDALHCHHVNKNPMDNRLENLAWLCIPCHAQAHSE